MNSNTSWKWVGIISVVLVLSLLCCLVGLCWGGVFGLFLGQRISVSSSGWAEKDYETPFREPYVPEETRRPWLGVYFQTTPQGALVTRVVLESPAERAGLRPGDVIIEFDGQQVTEEQPLDVIVAQYAPGDEITLVILRGQAERDLTVTLGVFPGLQRMPDFDDFSLPRLDEG